MKKIWILLSALVLCLALVGCGNREADNTANDTTDNEAVDETLDDEANNEDQVDEVNLERADEAEKR